MKIITKKSFSFSTSPRGSVDKQLFCFSCLYLWDNQTNQKCICKLSAHILYSLLFDKKEIVYRNSCSSATNLNLNTISPQWKLKRTSNESFYRTFYWKQESHFSSHIAELRAYLPYSTHSISSYKCWINFSSINNNNIVKLSSGPCWSEMCRVSSSFDGNANVFLLSIISTSHLQTPALRRISWNLAFLQKSHWW